MLEARCPKCGYHCYGWALTEPKHQICPECGSKLELIREQNKDEEKRIKNKEKGKQ